MDDLSRKLEDILNDPESMNKVRIMAEKLLGDEEETESKNGGEGESPSAFSGADISNVMKIMGRLNSKSDDSRIKLLLALKPNLSEKRRQKVDLSIKLLKLIELLPLLKDSGILDFGG